MSFDSHDVQVDIAVGRSGAICLPTGARRHPRCSPRLSVLVLSRQIIVEKIVVGLHHQNAGKQCAVADNFNIAKEWMREDRCDRYSTIRWQRLPISKCQAMSNIT